MPNDAFRIGLALLVGASLVVPARSASDTPQAVYDRAAGCAGIAAAAVAYEQMLSGSEKDRSDARTALTASRAQAEKAGAEVGATPEQIVERIEGQKNGILAKLNKLEPGSEGRKKEEADLGRTVLACAIVTAMERKDDKAKE